MKDLKIIALLVAGLAPIFLAAYLAGVIGRNYGYWAYSLYALIVFALGVFGLSKLGSHSTMQMLGKWVTGSGEDEDDQNEEPDK